MTDRNHRRPYVSTVEEFDVSSTERTVTVRKIETPKGERVEFESSAEARTLSVDALGLESLTWQSPDVFTVEPVDENDAEPLEEDADEVDCDVEFELMNEYAYVRVRRLQSPVRTTLEIHAPKKRERIQITPAGLEGLARRDHTVFSEYLEQPHGPEDHH
ncbi:hypothetical protein [Halopenitus sp. POP-27]|uniref:hypothetical protein n=1 Tax=Halopenitus sp. POP-27 TaxID=2994425 RepID=UPI002468DDBD|nr:hypothetical protein [Halopenitus sp. POP-27]